MWQKWPCASCDLRPQGASPASVLLPSSAACSEDVSSLTLLSLGLLIWQMGTRQQPPSSPPASGSCRSNGRIRVGLQVSRTGSAGALLAPLKLPPKEVTSYDIGEARWQSGLSPKGRCGAPWDTTMSLSERTRSMTDARPDPVLTSPPESDP